METQVRAAVEARRGCPPTSRIAQPHPTKDAQPDLGLREFGR